MTECDAPKDRCIYQAVHGLKELEGVPVTVANLLCMDAKIRQVPPDVAGHCNDHLAFDVWHCDAELLAHLPHHIALTAFQEGIVNAPLL